MKTKRFLSIILTLVLLLTAAAVCALPTFADGTVITEVDVIGFKEPEVGQTVRENVASIALPEGARYKLDEYFWSNEDTGEIMADPEKFEADTAYSFAVTLLPAAGCSFDPDVRITVNGDPALVEITFVNMTPEGLTALITPSFLIEGDGATYISEVSLDGYTEPAAGTKASEAPLPTIPQDASYYVEEMYWWCETDYKEMKSRDIFEKGKQYSLVVALYPEDGCSFKFSTQAYVNGEGPLDKDATAYTRIDGAFYIWMTPFYPASDGEPDTVSAVDVTITSFPIAGLTPEELPEPYSENIGYEVSAWRWCNDTDERYMERGEAFEEGKTYSLFMVVDEVPGFVFAEDVTLTINGETDLVAADATVSSFRTISMQPPHAIDSVCINGVKEPQVGQTVGENLASITLPEGAPYSVDLEEGVLWICLDEAVGIGVLYPNDKFEAGKTYYLAFNVVAADGYAFNPSVPPKVLFNGETTLAEANGSIVGDLGVSVVCITVAMEPKTADILYGDVFTDGYVNKKDSLALRRYLADNNYEIDLAAADVFYDGVVNKKDSLRLKQYLAGWDVKLGA